MVHLGIGSYTWPVYTAKMMANNGAFSCAAELLTYAKVQKIHYVQFGDNLPLQHMSDQERQEMKRIAAEGNIRIQVGSKRLTKECVEKYVQIASFFASPFLRVVIDDGDYHPDEATVVSIIRSVLPTLDHNNVVLAIENHDRFSARTLKRIIASTSEKLVGICLDTANSLGAGEGIGEVINELGPYAVNLHVKDILIRRVPNKMGFTVTGAAAGSGMINIHWVIDTLRQWHKCDTATLELWLPETDRDQTALQREREWSDISIQYLKKILS